MTASGFLFNNVPVKEPARLKGREVGVVTSLRGPHLPPHHQSWVGKATLIF